MEPDYLVPKLSAMFFAPLPLQMHLLLQPFVPESALGVDGARQAPPLPCLSDKAAAFLGFHIACVGANHPSALRGSEDSLKNPWCCCAVCSVRSRERVKVGALARAALPSSSQPPAGLGSALPEPSETCITLLGGLWPEPHPPQGQAPLPLPAQNSSPSTADNTGVLQTLEAWRT